MFHSIPYHILTIPRVKHQNRVSINDIKVFFHSMTLLVALQSMENKVFHSIPYHILTIPRVKHAIDYAISVCMYNY